MREREQPAEDVFGDRDSADAADGGQVRARGDGVLQQVLYPGPMALNPAQARGLLRAGHDRRSVKYLHLWPVVDEFVGVFGWVVTDSQPGRDCMQRLRQFIWERMGDKDVDCLVRRHGSVAPVRPF